MNDLRRLENTPHIFPPNLGVQKKKKKKKRTRFSSAVVSATEVCSISTEVVVPMPVETAPEGKQKAVYVDSQTAVKVLNRQRCNDSVFCIVLTCIRSSVVQPLAVRFQNKTLTGRPANSVSTRRRVSSSPCHMSV